VPCAVFEHAILVLQRFKVARVSLTRAYDSIGEMRIADVRNLSPLTSFDLLNNKIQIELPITSQNTAKTSQSQTAEFGLQRIRESRVMKVKTR
jgi:hypothetical protein